MATTSLYHHLVLLAPIFLYLSTTTHCIGINYGTKGNNLPPPVEVVKFLKTQTTIDAIKIYDTNPEILRAFANSNIAVTVGANNEDIPALAGLPFAKQWVTNNIAPYFPATKIIRIIVGNQILNPDTDPRLKDNLLPAMKSIHQALIEAKITNIQVTTAHSFKILEKGPPTVTRYPKGMDENVVLPILQFLRETKSVFVCNPFPFFNYGPNTLDYALFRDNKGVIDNFSTITFSNMFEDLVDSFYNANRILGCGDIPIVIGETGWPTLGDPTKPDANPQSASLYVKGVINQVTSGAGTKLQHDRKFETYLFALFDENERLGPVFEKHWGLFKPDFTPAYDSGVMRNGQPTVRVRGAKK